MSELNVRIVRLEEMRVASALGFGTSPEMLAWEKILAWGREKGLDLRAARYFGFNNPNPSPGSPNYGYEQWITVGPKVRADEGIEIKEIPGGLYAVARCQGVDNIFPTWQRLVAWLEDSPYRYGPQQCLEECLTPPIDSSNEETALLDLYLPLAG